MMMMMVANSACDSALDFMMTVASNAWNSALVFMMMMVVSFTPTGMAMLHIFGV